MKVVPMTLRAAREYVKANHRHHRAPQGGLFAIAAEHEGRIVGCVIAGKPVARMLNDGLTVEITRMCTDGTRNACSFLYRACVRAAHAIGYQRVLTYTLLTEGGASLRGAGFEIDGKTKAGSWSRPSRTRIDKHPTEQKLRWVAPFQPAIPSAHLPLGDAQRRMCGVFISAVRSSDQFFRPDELSLRDQRGQPADSIAECT